MTSQFQHLSRYRPGHNRRQLGGIGYFPTEASVAKLMKQSKIEDAPRVANQSQASKDQQEISEAAERVYERYGTDLAAFQRDVKREITTKRETEEKAPL